jgi:glycosyltransferase involved in cell wall biosynthesis
MNILQLAIRFPPAPGGAETHVLSVAEGLQQRGHAVKVYTTDLYTEMPFKKLEPGYEEATKLPVKRFKAYTMGNEMHYVLIPRMLPAVMRAKADIFHAHSYGYFHVNATAMARKFRETPFIITPHFHPRWSMWGGDRRKKLRWFYDRLFGKNMLAAADIVIGVSGHEMELIQEVGVDKSKIRIIPNGIHMSRFSPLPAGGMFRQHFKIDAEESLILYVGRIASNKGLDTLIRSLPQVLEEVPNAQLAIVGQDEGLKDELTELAKSLKVEGHILFTGHITDDMLFRSSFAACDVFVLPSEYEAFGIVLLEAMACEKPCIGTRVGGVPEVIEDGKTGLIVEYKDADTLGMSIIALLQDEDKSHEMGKLGRQRVIDNFTWDIVVDKIEKVYEEVLASK